MISKIYWFFLKKNCKKKIENKKDCKNALKQFKKDFKELDSKNEFELIKAAYPEFISNLTMNDDDDDEK